MTGNIIISNLPPPIQDLVAETQQAVAAAYKAGYRDGSKAAFNQVLGAISSVSGDAQTSGRPEAVSRSSGNLGPNAQSRAQTADGRAPRGAVRAALDAVLTAKPGSTTKELEVLVEQFDPGVSGRSVGAELRRHVGRVYRKQSGRWFLMGEKLQPQLPTVMETAEPQGPAVPQPQTTTEEGNAPATIAA